LSNYWSNLAMFDSKVHTRTGVIDRIEPKLDY
jgi:hypothetical protein